MTKLFPRRWYSSLLATTTVLTLSVQTVAVNAQQRMYNPIPLPRNGEISDVLSTQDIPTGEGGFSRDYVVNLTAGDQVAIDLASEEFDTVVSLIASDGSMVGENDDGPDGTTNSLLFVRITETGRYVVRVRAFGATSGGNFNLKVARLRPVND